uniref:Ubiquitin-like domain-containing protein n=1 Tax=Syphacia muris TaxID=451379 RepID=A0A0N5ASN0_9BILA
MDTDGFIFPSDLDGDDDEQFSASDVCSADCMSSEKSEGGTCDGDDASDAIKCIPLENCAGKLQKAVKRYKLIKNELKQRDILASQLAAGIYLQKEMDKCISCRQDFPIQLQFKVHKLSSGASILTVNVRNTGEFTLLDWCIAFTLQLLSEGSDTYEDGESRIFRLELDVYYYTLWNELSQIRSATEDMTDSNSSEDMAGFKENKTVTSYEMNCERVLRVPEAAVFLICQQSVSVKSLLSWILITNSPLTDTARCHCNFKDSVHYVTITVTKKSKYFEVKVAASNRELRDYLIQQLQTRLLIQLRYSRSKSLKKNADCEVLSSTADDNSLNGYFVNYLLRFI